jgi:dUTP pyrophosphatase
MHVLIKINNDNLKQKYENHSSFHEGDSGLDLFSPEHVVIPPKQKRIINTQICCEAKNDSLNVSFWMLPRSSVATKTPLIMANSVGLIDAGYRGNLMGVFYNTSDKEFVIEKGSRLLQICGADLKPVTFELVESLSSTSRNIGGYGSTGN